MNAGAANVAFVIRPDASVSVQVNGDTVSEAFQTAQRSVEQSMCGIRAIEQRYGVAVAVNTAGNVIFTGDRDKVELASRELRDRDDIERIVLAMALGSVAMLACNKMMGNAEILAGGLVN